ncbi:YgiQ family radical SAM protein [Desulfuromonas sp. AOP6]|uniref:YgiQ family radical SAM protein n=1 Tax=Desulfuromonas sp. AOP6 TaxID=1566351 RepID=UPI00127700BB|nr:YgiQ family radical SAM protein [Desulfuromonas sp. AOP6]BCA79597.1 UPF0313 protein [Desulfuromonas sp. AOP6]
MVNRVDFLPTCLEDVKKKGWDALDVLFVSGDAYVDHPSFGVPLLARYLLAHGFRVGILAQPDWRQREAFEVMGRPRLFAALSAGAMDSMVNHYTAARKRRRDDAYTPGGIAGARPDRALITYTAAVKAAFRGLPVILGGIEGSLRRLAHYDYWTDAVRRSILVDSKADLLVYGMGEKPLLEVARRMQAGESLDSIQDVCGTAFLGRECPPGSVELPSFEQVSQNKTAFNQAFRQAFDESNPFRGRSLCQGHGNRLVIVNPPQKPLSQEEMDRIYALPFTRRPHPDYSVTIPAFTQIRHSITSHRGCFGGCSFCAIAGHQGKSIQSRSEASILAEVNQMVLDSEFSGTITDVGGPTANMYGLKCKTLEAEAACRRASCLFPQICRNLDTRDGKVVHLLQTIRETRGVRHVFVASGVRFDLFEKQPKYFDELLKHHVGGLLKVAPESASDDVLALMHKPPARIFEEFLQVFRQLNRSQAKRLGIVPYFISGHPGSTLSALVDGAIFLCRNGLRVEQVQEFTPTPGTLSTCIYYTGVDPFSGKEVYVPRSARERRMQKSLLLWHLPESRQDILEALRLTGRMEDGAVLLNQSGSGGGLKERGTKRRADKKK